jgi:hypothetical protein
MVAAASMVKCQAIKKSLTDKNSEQNTTPNNSLGCDVSVFFCIEEDLTLNKAIQIAINNNSLITGTSISFEALAIDFM